MRNFAIVAIPALLCFALLAGCTADGGTGTVGFAVTDAPVDDYTHVNVTFSRGTIHAAGGDDNDTSGWIQIVNTTQTVDLLALHHNNTAKALGFAEVKAGKYTQIRIYVDSVEAIKKSDGSKVIMTVPSGVLKTSKSFEVKEGGNTTLTLEIDLNKSINCNNQGCKFAPVLGKVEAKEN